jgi:hypothetical protein
MVDAKLHRHYYKKQSLEQQKSLVMYANGQ